MTIREVLTQNESRGIGHFNISDLSALRAILEAAQILNVPIFIGTSEGEREFIGEREAVALIRSAREELSIPIFLNADHTYSLEKIKRAVGAGYDAVIFDGSKLSYEENIRQTREAVEYVRRTRPEVIVEGELGYIGTSSKILKEIPKGVSLSPEDLTSPEEARRFVRETGVDLLAPAVGNIHGMLVSGESPGLDIPRIAAIRQACGVPLVLHGGSGTTDQDFVAAIRAGVAIVHINTEIRKSWRKGIEAALADPDEVAPYKILESAKKEVKKTVLMRLNLFTSLN